jgi:hypothetical protein
VGFDRNDNFYVLVDQHNSGNTSGALVLSKFSFAGSTPSAEPITNSRPQYALGPVFILPSNDNIIYQWTAGSDAVADPTMLVDDNVAGFSASQSHPYASVNTNQFPGPNPPSFGDIYIAWASIDIKPSLVTDLTSYNPNRIKLIVSSDGGDNFTGEAIVNSGGNSGVQRDSNPQLVISQNNGGQVTVGWTDFGTLSTATPKQSLLVASSVTPGLDYAYNGRGEQIPAAEGGVADVPFTVNIPANELANLSNLIVSLAITHGTDADISIVLQSPNGNQITLVQNQDNAAGTANNRGGLTGANIGVINSFAVGTTFDDNATRNIFDPNTGGTNANTAPYVGNFQPEGNALNDTLVADNLLRDFLAHEVGLGVSAVDGTWTLVVTEVNHDTPPAARSSSTSRP